MARLWRSVIVLGLCFAAVVSMRIYLNKQLELARSTDDGSAQSSAVLAR